MTSHQTAAATPRRIGAWHEYSDVRVVMVRLGDDYQGFFTKTGDLFSAHLNARSARKNPT